MIIKPVWHIVPWNPDGHIHICCPKLFVVQIPPFKHGFIEHDPAYVSD